MVIKSRQVQNIKFRKIEEFMDFIPEHELKVVQVLRGIIINCIPGCREKLSYNVPTYYLNSRICFIWPSSVTWGNVTTNAVRLGFGNGYLMRDEINYLDKGNHKQVYWKDFSEKTEIDIDLLKSYIYEAARIDDEVYRKRSKKVKD